MRRAKKRRIKRIYRATFFTMIMAIFSILVYTVQLKEVQVDYLGNIVTFRTMAKTVAQAFDEKGIIITNGLVVSKELNSTLEKNNVISIDAPLILAQIEEEKKAEQAKQEINTEEEKKDEVTKEKVVKEAEKVEEKKKEETTKKDTVKKETKKETTSRSSSRGFSKGFEETAPGVITTAEGEVLEYEKVIQVEATAYCACYSCCGKYPSNKYYGITKTGTRAKVGTIAVDPKVIPLGTKMYVEGLNGAKNYGLGTAEDIGGAIKGNIIDLYFDTHAETRQWGRQQVNVYILKED